MSMRTDSTSGANGGGPQKSRSGLIPSAISTSWKYLKNVGGVGGVLGDEAGVAPLGAPKIGHLVEDFKKKEQVLWASFDTLDTAPETSLRILLLTYPNGFQAWDVHSAGDVRELVSRRDGPVSSLRVLPHPSDPEPEDSPLAKARPLLAVVAGGEGFRDFDQGEEPGADGGARFAVGLYSLQSHAYVHALRFRTAVVGVQASRKLVAVALFAQIYCFDAATLSNTFSVLTYPAPQLAPGIHPPQQGAMALSQQWLGYAANQPLITPTGRVSPQCLSSPSPSPSTSPANAAHLVAHYAKESSRHLAAGVLSLGDMGYKTLNSYVREFMQPEGGPNANGGPNAQPGAPPAGAPNEQEYAGTVIIRDVATRNVVAQFRAHTSPLSALAFDPSGTLVVTASVCGHSLNIFRITPQSKGLNPSSLGSNGETHSTAHLYRLHRGMTNAVIQDIRFSGDSEWVAVSTTRGTTHMYAVSRTGGHVGPSTHVKAALRGQSQAPTSATTWQSPGGSQVGAPPGVTLSVVARIRNSNGGWRGSVTGVAAAATGRANTILGAVATCFHSGKTSIAPEERAAGFLEEQLYVLSPQGYLLRYWLRPLIGCDSSSANAPEVLKLAIEPRERWDVCRRVSWVEREERMTYQSDASLPVGSEIGPIERGVQTSDDAFVVKAETGVAVSGNGPPVNAPNGFEGAGANVVSVNARKGFGQRPPRHNAAIEPGAQDHKLGAFGSGTNGFHTGLQNGLFTSGKPNGATAIVSGEWGREPVGVKPKPGKEPWPSLGPTPVANGHAIGADLEEGTGRRLSEGDLFDDQNSEGSFEVSQTSSPPSSFESPRYLLQKQFASSPIPGPFLTAAMLNQRHGETARVPSLDLDSEDSTPRHPRSTSGDSAESLSPSSPSPQTSPGRSLGSARGIDAKSSPTQKDGSSAAEPFIANQGASRLFGGEVSTTVGKVGSSPKGKTLGSHVSSDVSSDRSTGLGFNGLGLNGLIADGGLGLWGIPDAPHVATDNGGVDRDDGTFLSPVLQSGFGVKRPAIGGQEPTPGTDGSPKSTHRTDDSSRKEGDGFGKLGRRDSKLGDEKGGLLGGLRGLMSSGAQGLAAAVTAVGGAPPRDSLLDQDPAPVAKVYQHPIPVGDRKKPTGRNGRWVSGSKPRGGAESKVPVTAGRVPSPAGSRGVSPVGSPGGFAAGGGFGGSPMERCLTPSLMDKRGKLMGGRNGERSHSGEVLHAEEGLVFTGAVAEAKDGVKEGGLLGDWGDDSGGGKKNESSMDGWEQQGFLEGFSLSEDE